MNNPYTTRGPVQNAGMFFGRTHELNEIGSFLRGNQSVSIVGPRRIGKTSLMLHLMRPQTMRLLQMERDYLMVYVDCQMLDTSRPDEVFAHLCAETAAAVRAHELEPVAALDAATSAPTRLSFEGALRRLNERGLGIVFMLDEFEGIARNPHVDVNLFNALRSAAGRLRLAFVTASAEPLFDLTYSGSCRTLLSSPFFNIFAQIYLGLLPESEARALIREPMEAAGIEPNTRLEDHIYQLVGGYPLGLQVACYHACENPADLAEISRRTSQELESHFEYYWRHLSPKERDLLRGPLAAGPSEAVDPATRSILRDLVQKCLLTPVAASYSYPSRAWADFVSTRPPDAPEGSSIQPPTDVDADDIDHPADRASSSENEDRTATGSGRRQGDISDLFRESLPEMLGAVGAAIVLGIVGLIYPRLPAILQEVGNLLIHYSVAGLVLAALGVLAVGIAGGHMIWARKRRRLLARRSGYQPPELSFEIQNPGTARDKSILDEGDGLHHE